MEGSAKNDGFRYGYAGTGSARQGESIDLHKKWCTRAAFWRGYRRKEAARKENQEKSAFGQSALRHREL